MSNENKNQLTPQEERRMSREIVRLQKHLEKMHTLRNKINRALSRVHEDNLSLALTQKKNLRVLSKEYDDLVQEIRVLPAFDAAQVLEDEYNYILTVGNVIETTRELRKHPTIGDENTKAIISGLVQFYDGLRAELAEQEKQHTASDK